MTAVDESTASATPEGEEPLLQVENLRKYFPVKRGIIFQKEVGAVKAVDGLTFSIKRGETLGMVGETGCGKSTVGRLLTRLLEPSDGRIRFEGHDITHMSRAEMRPLRKDIQIIFQDPYSSLNPRHTIGTIVGAPFHLQGVQTDSGVKKAVQDLLALVGLNPEHYNRWPHEFSGGQRQRIGIARALALRPKLIVCDEPVSALDVSIQAQVINLLEDLQDEFDLTYMFIAHDLSVVRHISDRVVVMYLGKIVEVGERDQVYEHPAHPYTQALLSAVPIPDPRRERERERIVLEGDVPSPSDPPTGCRYRTRCQRFANELSDSERQLCIDEEPALELRGQDHPAACHYAAVQKVI
jgi:oligopeptide/dipeptide ABC transporter ATP-binding protein